MSTPQLDLGAAFLPTRAVTRRGHPDTSREAAATVTITPHQILVLRYYQWRIDNGHLPAVADEDAVSHYNSLHEENEEFWPAISPSGFRSRRAELARAGALVPGPIVRTATGRKAQTWRRP